MLNVVHAVVTMVDVLPSAKDRIAINLSTLHQPPDNLATPAGAGKLEWLDRRSPGSEDAWSSEPAGTSAAPLPLSDQALGQRIPGDFAAADVRLRGIAEKEAKLDS